MTNIAKECSGYLLLEYCKLSLGEGIAPRKKEWIEVDINQFKTSPPSDFVDDHGCRLFLGKDSCCGYYVSFHGKPFRGNVSDVDGSIQEHCDDAIRVASLLHTCQTEHPSAQLQYRLQVLVHDDATGQASLVWLVTFPLLETEGGILPSKKQAKILSSPLQLLLLTLESDFSSLKKRKEEMIRYKPCNGASEQPSLFPQRCSLEEVYTRINKQVVPPFTAEASSSQPDSVSTLPQDILIESLAPFFTATELARVRQTCRYLNYSLRAVVPGLTLSLYQHQVASLTWMRTRERISTEVSSIEEHSKLGDIQQHHRAVTGGATTRLGNSVSVSTTTGKIVPSLNHDGLSRREARGGLLCDDPGLGKTITVLSLVLQTSPAQQQLSEPNGGSPISPPKQFDHETKEERTETDDSVFYAYWSDNVVKEFRVPALLKLLNDLGKRCPPTVSAAFFSLRRAVEAHALGTSFDEFEQAVW